MEIVLIVLVILVVLAVVGVVVQRRRRVGRGRGDARPPQAAMSVLMRAREIGGRPVVTLDTAEDVAEVKDVLFSYASTSVVGFTLNKRGFLGSPMKEHLPWSRVAALGRDAVMIESRAELGAGDAAMEDAAASGERDVIGATVMTDGGTRLGTVEDVIVKVGDGTARVVGFEVHGPEVERDRAAATLLLPVDDTLAVSGETLMVPAAAEEFVRDDLSGFGSAVDEFRRRLGSGLVRLSEADGRPVISRASAETLGELKHVVVDVARPAHRRAARGRRQAQRADGRLVVDRGLRPGRHRRGGRGGEPARRRPTPRRRSPRASSTSTGGWC